jgi:hypothetical protein
MKLKMAANQVLKRFSGKIVKEDAVIVCLIALGLGEDDRCQMRAETVGLPLRRLQEAEHLG